MIAAALTALFLGALDALVMAAAMPTIVADLGGLALYSWVYSAYFLARAISLPIFGKLADLLRTKALFMTSIAIFLFASLLAGLSENMPFLIFSRVLQGIGAGGNFALVYIVLTDVSAPGKRGKTLGLASFVWGAASLLGPTLGGFVVAYFSWRWIFFMNVPLALLSLAGLYFFLAEFREKRKKVHLDLAGVFFLSLGVLSLLAIFLLGGRNFPWISREIFALGLATVACSAGFYLAEKRAPEPILSLGFFRLRGFSTGNAAVFLSSFVIFALFAYAPLFIQGVLLKTPVEVGVAMLSLSFGWSVGSLAMGQVVHKAGEKKAASLGAFLLSAGAACTIAFSAQTTMELCFWTFMVAGLGMGFVTLSTLLIVQNSLERQDMGVATSSHQFARTLGGTVGIGICGGLFTSRLGNEIRRRSLEGFLQMSPGETIGGGLESMFDPEKLSSLPRSALESMQEATLSSFSLVFCLIACVSLACLACCLMLPGEGQARTGPANNP